MTLYDTIRRKGSVEYKGNNPLGIDEWVKPHEAMQLAPFWGTMGREARKSVSGTAVWSGGLYFGDQFHRYEVDDYFNQFDFTMNQTDATVADGTKIRDIMADVEDRLFDFAYNKLDEMAEPDAEMVAEWANCNFHYMMRESWFRAGKCEAEVRSVIEEHFDADVLAISQRYDDGEHETAISEVTEWERPEARGIDLYLPDERVGIQVKTEGGGEWRKERDEIEADVLARVFYKDSYLPVIQFSRIKE